MTTNPKHHRDTARRRASEGIQQLLDAGISSAYIAEAYATAGINLLLEHHSYEDARDLLTALWMQLDRHECASPHNLAASPDKSDHENRKNRQSVHMFSQKNVRDFLASHK